VNHDRNAEELYFSGDRPQRGTHRDGGFFAGSVAFGVELGRLERALRLELQALGYRRYLVAGGEQLHYVDLGSRAPCPCDCDDRVVDSPCKHMLRAMLFEGNDCVLKAVAALVMAFREYATDLEKQVRAKPIRVTNEIKGRVALAVRHPASALTFTRRETGTDNTVAVQLGTTEVTLGHLVRDESGVAFIPAAEETERAAA
jgi:hypothetical protein